MTALEGPRLRTLSNGVRVIVDPMPGLQTIACGVWVNAGARDERPDERGAAHLIEHMAFKGAGDRSAKEIVEAIEGVGGWINAETTHERTAFFVRCLKDDMALGLDVLSDIALAPRFDPDDLAIERGVVVQEIGEAADNPEDCAYEGLQEVAFAGSTLGCSILGEADAVRARTVDDLRRFFREAYRPEGMIVAIAGGIDVEAAFDAAERRFGVADRGEGARRARPAAAFHGGLKFIDAPSEQAHVAMAFRGAAAGASEEIAARLFAEALGGGMASRLFQELRERRGLAYTIDAAPECYSDVGAVVVYAGVDHDRAAELVQEVRRQASLLGDEIGQIELDRAKAVLRAGAMMALEQPMGRIEAAVGATLSRGRPLAPAELTALINSVGVDDVRAAARVVAEGPVAACVVGGNGHQLAVSAVEAAMEIGGGRQ
ncbi:MAG: pitrilysin family protein [Pseudomonadota bacterium]